MSRGHLSCTHTGPATPSCSSQAHPTQSTCPSAGFPPAVPETVVDSRRSRQPRTYLHKTHSVRIFIGTNCVAPSIGTDPQITHLLGCLVDGSCVDRRGYRPPPPPRNSGWVGASIPLLSASFPLGLKIWREFRDWLDVPLRNGVCVLDLDLSFYHNRSSRLVTALFEHTVHQAQHMRSISH